MDTKVPADGEALNKDEETTDDILESLLVDDAPIEWDPVTGKPRVAKPKSELDSPPESA